MGSESDPEGESEGGCWSVTYGMVWLVSRPGEGKGAGIEDCRNSKLNMDKS